MISQSTIKNQILSSFDPSTSLAYNFLLLKANETRLVSSERSFIKLTEAYEFYLIWLENGGTVTSQSTVKNLIFSSFDLSSLLAYNFLVACTRLYTPLCPSVRRSVGRLVPLPVCRLVGPSVRLSATNVFHYNS